MKHRFLITTVVDERYQFYIPLFILCLKKNYPEYDIKLFTHGEFQPEVKRAIEIVGEECEFVGGLFDGWVNYKYSPISWRFVVPPEHYKDYDCVYITDIDMMIMREPVTLLNFHLNELGETGLCYSNSLRNSKHWKGTTSLTGLHFCTTEWFERTEDVRSRFAKQLKEGAVGEKREYDGHLLYLMVRDANLGICGKYLLVERHHGLHLGNLRLFTNERKLYKRMPPPKIKKWLKLQKDPRYGEIYSLICANPMVREQLKMLDEYCIRTLSW